MNDSKRGSHKPGKGRAKRKGKPAPRLHTGAVASNRLPLHPASKLSKRRDSRTLSHVEPALGQLPLGVNANNESQLNLRIVQIELKKPLRRIPIRAKSRSPFRFTTTAGRHIPGLHEVVNRHELHNAHASFRGRHPRQHRRRSQAEKDNISRFVDLHFPADADIEAILRDLRELPQVERAVEVPGIKPAAIPSDPLVGPNDQLASDPNTGYEFQWYVYRCGVNRAWAKVSGKGVVIADIDAGFYLDHQDVAANVERSHAHNAVDGSNDVTAGNDTGHGTAVLGIAGGASNKLGIAGFAFGARLWPIQVDAGNGSSLLGDPLANGIDWVLGENSQGRRVVINVEHQTTSGANCEQIPAVNAAIRLAINKGFVVCVAGGNGDRDAGTAEDGTQIPPTGSILVGATAYDSADNPRAASGLEGSNWGARVMVSAPGDQNHDVTCSIESASSYRNDFGGTSGAAAKVAGTIALMLEANPRLTHEQVKSILVNTGSALNADKPIGVFLNADAAVSAALASRKT